MNVHYAQRARDYHIFFDVELVITRAPLEIVSDAMRSMPEAEADPATRRCRLQLPCSYLRGELSPR